MKKYIMITILMINLVSCKNEKQEKKAEKETKKIEIINDFIETYEGNINGKYEILMKLNSDNGKIKGSYFYKKNGVKIDIIGRLKNDSSITLNEFDTKGSQTGVFKGKMLSKSEIKGKWSKSNGENEMDFSLIETNTNYESIVNLKTKTKILSLGEHKFGVQFIDYYGSAIITESNNSLHISGSQFSIDKTEYSKIKGEIKIFTDRKFTVEGEIEIFTHDCCGVEKKSGVFTFLRSGKRKYWRLQERELFCSRHTCAYYMDIFKL